MRLYSLSIVDSTKSCTLIIKLKAGKHYNRYVAVDSYQLTVFISVKDTLANSFATLATDDIFNLLVCQA